jgi:hypothetical protein
VTLECGYEGNTEDGAAQSALPALLSVV